MKLSRQVRSNNSAVALIIVLALVVLLTGVALAYFSRATIDRQVSYSSASQSSAELLARGALAITVGDLRQEIAAGSTASTVSGFTIYSPKPSPSPSTLIPALAGSIGTGGLENLVKRSAYQVPFYANQNPVPNPTPYNVLTYPPANRAAGPSTSSSTTALSLNNRSISAARWNKPLLLMKATIASDTDLRPVAGFTPPDWILVARDGSNPPTWSPNLITSASNTTSVVGRYAYTIYDEGGLLDMNVAGYPPAPVSTAAQFGRKGTQAYADLTQIPGVAAVAGITPSLTAAKQTKLINNIVGWRNFASSAATGSLGNFSMSNSYVFASGTSFYNSILSSTTGFLRVSNSTLNTGQSDRMFTSRQELINLLLKGTASGGTSPASAAERANLQYALQYLGTFSRELNRPSWKPYTPTGSAIDYALLSKTPTSETSSAINRDLTAVRDPGGNPLLKMRFPLGRIDELLNTANIALIQSDFGLRWNVDHWDYVGPTGTALVTSIEKLNQVASENRTPNFFEILKAVILSGSVGLGSGDPANPALQTFVASEPKYYSQAGGLSADYQIMQIGANVLDAWDSNNIPTFINFAGNDLSGVENLPYLSKLVFDFWVSSHGAQGDGTHDQWWNWLVPSFWNPHQNAASAPTTQAVRFVMTSGSVRGQIVLDDGTSYPSNIISSTGTTPYIEIKANAFATACPAIPNPAYSPAPTNENVSSSAGITPTIPDGMTTFGVYDGIGTATSVQTFKLAYKNVKQVYPLFGANTTFQMQVQKPDGTWGKAYQTWSNCSDWNPVPPGTPIIYNSVYNRGNNSYKDFSFQDPEFVTLDPRTVRFGVWGSQGIDWQTQNDKNYSAGAEDSMDQRLTSGKLEGIASAMRPLPAATFPMTVPANPPGPLYLEAFHYASNTSNFDYYNDLDGVKRRGDWTTDASGVASTKTIMYASASPSPIPQPTPNNSQDRPQMLSGRFQSVSDLGQVFRDQPWKTLNFTTQDTNTPPTTARSADAGLLDAFTLQDSAVAAGKTSLNTRQKDVLIAILSQGSRNLTGTSLLTAAQIYTAGNPPGGIVPALMNLTLTPPAGQPMLINKSELVTRLSADTSVTSLGNKEARESVIRALSDSTQTRTWNLMIDVIAQTGRYPSSAQSLANFIVEGEKRYWLHVAIDRFTGEVIDQQLEAVYE